MIKNRQHRRARSRIVLRGTGGRPRLVVFRSNRFIYGQVIDDTKGHTLASVNKETDAAVAGEKIAKAALAKKVSVVVFDRAGYRYHGRVRKLAEAAKAAGLKF